MPTMTVRSAPDIVRLAICFPLLISALRVCGPDGALLFPNLPEIGHRSSATPTTRPAPAARAYPLKTHGMLEEEHMAFQPVSCASLGCSFTLSVVIDRHCGPCCSLTPRVISHEMMVTMDKGGYQKYGALTTRGHQPI